MKVSVIVPLYNKAEYLSEAIESWRRQSIYDKELIIIDDCSTDESFDIAQKYSNMYENIDVSRNNCNMGPALTRNNAIKKARGEYVAFLDADDCFNDSVSLECMYNAAKRNDADVCGGFLTFWRKSGCEPYYRYRNFFIDSEKSEKNRSFRYCQDDFYFQSYIYKKEYLSDKSIFFPDLRMHEDPIFLVRALNEANQITIFPTEYYSYRVNENWNGISPKAIKETLIGEKMVLEYSLENGLEELFYNNIKRIDHVYRWYVFDALSEYYDDLACLISDIKTLAQKGGMTFFIGDYLDEVGTNNSEKVFANYSLRENLNSCGAGNSIVIYGAGKRGVEVVNRLVELEEYEVSIWIDANKVGSIISNIEIQSLSGLDDEIKDKTILIAIEDEQIVLDVKTELFSLFGADIKVITWAQISRGLYR